VNQFHGISDLSLAMKLGTFLGIDVTRATSNAFSRTAIVRAIKEAVEET
jgi:RNase P protein component